MPDTPKYFYLYNSHSEFKSNPPEFNLYSVSYDMNHVHYHKFNTYYKLNYLTCTTNMNSRLDTNKKLNMNNTYKFHFKCKLSSSVRFCIYSTYKYNTNCFNIEFANATRKLRLYSKDANGTGIDLSTNLIIPLNEVTEFIVIVSPISTGISLNYTMIKSNGTSTSGSYNVSCNKYITDQPLSFFHDRRPSTTPFNPFELYFAKLYENNELIMDYEPYKYIDNNSGIIYGLKNAIDNSFLSTAYNIGD